MKRETNKPESERECGCKTGSGSGNGGGSCCQTNNVHPETAQNHEHGSEHNCGHSCDCK